MPSVIRKTAMPGSDSRQAALLAKLASDHRKPNGQRYFAEAQFEQPVAAARQAVIVTLGPGACQDLDLAIVEPEAAIDRRLANKSRSKAGKPGVSQRENRRQRLTSMTDRYCRVRHPTNAQTENNMQDN
jgi:hypothetical protein